MGLGQLCCLYPSCLFFGLRKRPTGQRKAGMDVYIHFKTGVKTLKKTFLQKKVWQLLLLFELEEGQLVICSQPIATWCGFCCLHTWTMLMWNLNGCQETKPWRGKIECSPPPHSWVWEIKLFTLSLKINSKGYYTWNNCWTIPCLTYISVMHESIPRSELNCPLYCPQKHN